MKKKLEKEYTGAKSKKEFLKIMERYDSGKGVEIIIDGKDGKLQSYQKILSRTEKSPQIGRKRLNISFSSVDQDNEQLLHFLLNKTK
ncbi:MAG: hypothetical protein NT068_01935 [Candidatus Nomurabacteria bacterium]|nr:hypothetical protein [Candidatus Nomurabacteria bacterium]